MKRIVTLLILVCLMAQLHAQTLREKINFSTNFTVGMPLADSDVKPLSLLASAEYQLHPQFSAGLGSGVSKYDHLMLPVFATLHWQISKPHRFTPFLGCNVGHAFVPKEHVSGGFYLTPSVGVSYKLKGRQSLSLSMGYELQEYSQLVTYESNMYLTQYVEDISSHALTASIGFTF
jgi:hypothetical protein